MTQKKIASWIVPLVGHRFDLEEMPKWFEGWDVRIVNFEDGYALAIPVEVIGDKHDPVLAFAEERLSLINGIGRLLGSKFRPVTANGTFYGLDADGSKVQTIASIQGSEVRMRLGAVGVLSGGPVPPDPAIGAAIPLLTAASNLPQAHDALTIIGRKDLTWSELYLLFELVQSDVGGEMHNLGWASKADTDDFSHTANSYSALRSEGRHGKDIGRAPSKPMERTTAIALIRGLVLAWLRSTAQKVK
jgi:hypothetical protein